ncbi:hypothetical protein [Rubrivirga marina]|uniref:DUF5666 domain-containing protein n=1 Tax=Rubrivirga marina TaxID=1196024 RepID=A0A271J1R4_9BACT|nr:hypothetical protein [Rubrivirga marina]PAP77247.1 hypothetical protein BSZ37_12790 [Rubrivirga marina]
MRFLLVPLALLVAACGSDAGPAPSAEAPATERAPRDRSDPDALPLSDAPPVAGGEAIPAAALVDSLRAVFGEIAVRGYVHNPIPGGALRWPTAVTAEPNQTASDLPEVSCMPPEAPSDTAGATTPVVLRGRLQGLDRDQHRLDDCEVAVGADDGEPVGDVIDRVRRWRGRVATVTGSLERASEGIGDRPARLDVADGDALVICSGPDIDHDAVAGGDPAPAVTVRGRVAPSVGWSSHVKHDRVDLESCEVVG